MLITKIKAEDSIVNPLGNKAFIINCHGCMEVSFPMEEACEIQKDWKNAGCITGEMTTDYICQPENLSLRLSQYKAEIDLSDMILVFSCGVGVQTVAKLFPDKKVFAECDTIRLPGFQGVTPLEHDCGQCGECYLNITGGICPITACSKSLLNGQCGGAKNGKCEVDSNMECGWERIYRRLEKLGRLDALKCPVQVRNYSTDDDISKTK